LIILIALYSINETLAFFFLIFIFFFYFFGLFNNKDSFTGASYLDHMIRSQVEWGSQGTWIYFGWWGSGKGRWGVSFDYVVCWRKKETDQGALETNFYNQSHGEEDWLYISNGKTPSTVENPGRFRSGRLGGWLLLGYVFQFRWLGICLIWESLDGGGPLSYSETMASKFQSRWSHNR